MKKRIERETFHVFRDLVETHNTLSLAHRIDCIAAYIGVIGGVIKEENLINILEWSKIDLDNEEEFATVIRGFSFYVGARLIKVIDEQMGLAELINNPDNDVIRFGEQRDVTEVVKIMETIRNRVDEE